MLYSYRFGFNGQEKEPEIGNSFTTAEFWMYDGRLGHRWNIDPENLVWLSPYATLENSPIRIADPQGNTGKDVVAGLVLGAIDNINPFHLIPVYIPGRGVEFRQARDLYTPDDNQYAYTLMAVDDVSFAAGVTLTIDGAKNITTGLAIDAAALAAEAPTLGTSSVALVPGTTIAVAGVVETAAGTTLTANSAINIKQGYGKYMVLTNDPQVKEVGGYKVGPYEKVRGSKSDGTEAHHGVMSAYFKRIWGSKYNPLKAPAVRMSELQHAATKKYFNTWKASMKEKMGGTFDFSKVSKEDLINLWQGMFDAAGTPNSVRKEYYEQLSKFVKQNKPK